MLFLALMLQAAPPPDIQLNIHATAREVRIQRRGEASLEVRAGPNAGSKVDVSAPPANGQTRLRNVTVDVRAEARIADPMQNQQPAETTRPD